MRLLVWALSYIQSGWKESHSHFLMELKTLQAYGICTFGQSLKAALDLLNSPRLHTGIDNYGQASLNCALTLALKCLSQSYLARL